jgi:chromosome segregation ATPase
MVPPISSINNPYTLEVKNPEPLSTIDRPKVLSQPTRFNWKEIVMISALALAIIGTLAAFIMQLWFFGALGLLLSAALGFGAYQIRKYGALEQLNKVVNSLSDITNDLGEINFSLRQVNSDLEKTAGELKNTSEEFKDTSEKLKKTSDDYKQMYEEYKQLSEKYKQTSEEYQQISEDLKQTSAEYKQTSEEYKETSEALKGEVADFQNENASLKENIKELTGQISNLEVTGDNLRALLEEEKTRQKRHEAYLEQLKRDINSEEQKLSDAVTKTAVQQEVLRNTVEDLKKVRADYSELYTKYAILVPRIEEVLKKE